MKNLYKKFNVNQKSAKPGDLLIASRTYKKRRKSKSRYEGSKLDKYLDKKFGYKEGSKKDEKIDREVSKRLPKKISKRGVQLMMKKKSKKGSKNWIQGAIKHPGSLRRSLGVKKGSKIPASKLAAAAKKGGKIGKRARLAETLKSFHAKKSSKKKVFTKCM